MDFGQLPPHRGFDRALPSLDPQGVKRLSGKPFSEPLLYLGAPQWNAPSWKGRFYPKDTPQDSFLDQYAKIWNSIEFNSSFYRNPSFDQVEKWKEKVKINAHSDFRFFIKIFQGLSHDPLFWAEPAAMGERIRGFIDSWKPLGEMWQGSFLQLPPEFSLNDLGSLERWISFWPKERDLDIEFRHPSWFQNRQLHPAAHTLLVKNEIAAVVTDTPGRRDASHGSLTSARLTIRFLAQSSESESEILPSDLERVDAWAKRVAGLFSRGLKQCSFFVHTPEEYWVPNVAREFLRSFEKYSQKFGIQVPCKIPEPVQESQLGFSF